MRTRASEKLLTEMMPGPRKYEQLHGSTLERANAIYASVHFAASDPESDATYGVVECDRVLCLGRIQRHPDGELEVGGFWVHEAHRNRGLARDLVRHVLSKLPAGRTVWCIPFAHLEPFYETFGMRKAAPESAPPSIRSKLEVCDSLRDQGHHGPVGLLRFETPT